jgi:hypothetical protein
MAHLFLEADRYDGVGIRGTHFTIPIVKERVTGLLSDKVDIGIGVMHLKHVRLLCFP